MKSLFFYFFIFISFSYTLSQNYYISGVIRDSKSNKQLSFANIRIEGTTHGTAANIEGVYKIRLDVGSQNIIASYIGYKSDTVSIKINENKHVDFLLDPIEIKLEEVVVEPGRNPAYDIIKNAIQTKKDNKNKTNNYKYSSYTKGLIKTTKDIANRSLSLTTQDTGKLKITGILENESRGFFKKPDKNKHFIVARKQSANTPPFINILTGGNVIQSFYEDQLTFIGKQIPSPVSDEALSYYYFYIEKEIANENGKVYQIFFNTDNTANPGFYGKLFIADSSFHLLKVDVNLNQMANPGGLFKFVNIYQQFNLYNDEIALPIDYRLFAEGNYLGLAKFGFELHTIMNSYEINKEIDDELFDNAIISVLPEADNRDDTYWSSIQSIPNTLEETKAYLRIDSLTQVSKTFGQDFSFLSPQIELNDNFSITGPLSFYSFNKIQGNTLNLELSYNDAENQRLDLSGRTSYGFADKLVKKELNGSYSLGRYRTSKISLNIFDKITDLFSVSKNYNNFTSTILSLFTKYDFRDYYYTKGIEADFSSEVLPLLNIGLGYFSKNDRSAKNNSDFSFFNTDKKYSENLNIYDVNTNGVKASVKIDFRKYIEDGFFRRRITSLNNIQFAGSVLYSNRSLLKSDLDFAQYKFETYGAINTAGSWSLNFYGNTIFSNNSVPLQWLYSLPGNINASGKNNSFRTLRIGEVFGDKVTTLFLSHDFHDDLFRFSQIPILKDLQLQLTTYLNMAISDISNESKKILSTNYKKFEDPFYELGFSIGHILIPIKLEFTWKLNYRGKNNFVFGINTLAI